MSKSARTRAGKAAAEGPRDEGLDGDRLRRQLQAKEDELRERLALFAEEMAAEEARRARRIARD